MVYKRTRYCHSGWRSPQEILEKRIFNIKYKNLISNVNKSLIIVIFVLEIRCGGSTQYIRYAFSTNGLDDFISDN